MRLNTAQVHKVEQQLHMEAVPREHPVFPKLEEAFGDHSFFWDAQGLNIIEQHQLPDAANGNVVRLASWESGERKELLAHPPEVLPLTVALSSNE